MKHQRLRCRTLQCDAILIANENELFKKKIEIVENKVKTLKEKYQAKAKNMAGKDEKKAASKAKGNKSKSQHKDDKVDKELAKELADVEEVALDLKQEVADKTRNLYLRTGSITPFLGVENRQEEVKSASGAPRSA